MPFVIHSFKEEVDNLQIEKVAINKLNPAKYNPRKDLKPGDAEYEKLKRSIDEFGYVETVIWNKRTGNIVGGHQRYKILKNMGLSEVECVVLDLDSNKEKALNVALNKIGGEFDIPLLTDLLKDLSDSDFDIALTGFDLTEVMKAQTYDAAVNKNVDVSGIPTEIKVEQTNVNPAQTRNTYTRPVEPAKEKPVDEADS